MRLAAKRFMAASAVPGYFVANSRRGQKSRDTRVCRVFCDANPEPLWGSDGAWLQSTAEVLDARNRLIQVTDRASVGGAPTQIIAYLYDVENRWIGENIESGASVIQHETRFVYDGNQIVLQFDEDLSQGSPPPSGEGVQLTSADLSHRYLWGPAVDQLLADEQVSTPQTPGNVIWPLTDNQGTVRDLAICNVTTGTTSVVNHLVYTSYGQLLSQTNPATGDAAAVDCLFGYAGLPFDRGSGMNMTLRRPYDPATGRFPTEDPTVVGGGDSNFYRYCGNSPTNATDPTGTELFADSQTTADQIIAWFQEKAHVTPIAVPVTVGSGLFGSGSSYYLIVVPAGSQQAVQDYASSIYWTLNAWFGGFDYEMFRAAASPTESAEVVSTTSISGTSYTFQNIDTFRYETINGMYQAYLSAGYSKAAARSRVESWQATYHILKPEPTQILPVYGDEDEAMAAYWTQTWNRCGFMAMVAAPGGVFDNGMLALGGFVGTAPPPTIESLLCVATKPGPLTGIRGVPVDFYVSAPGGMYENLNPKASLDEIRVGRLLTAAIGEGDLPGITSVVGAPESAAGGPRSGDYRMALTDGDVVSGDLIQPETADTNSIGVHIIDKDSQAGVVVVEFGKGDTAGFGVAQAEAIRDRVFNTPGNDIQRIIFVNNDGIILDSPRP
jgi:RHS repeat-associated protein